MTEDGEFDRKRIQTQLKNSRRKREAVRFMLDNSSFRNLRRFATYYDGDPEELDNMGLIDEGKGGAPIVIDQYNDRSWVPLGDEERIQITEDFLRKSMDELRDAGYNIPFNTRKGKLWEKIDNHQEWLDEIRSDVWFGDSEKAEQVDHQRFGFPIVTNISKRFSVPDNVREWLEDEVEELENTDIEFLEMFDELQTDIESGIYTAITKETETFYRWIYPELRDSGLSEPKVAEVMLEIEGDLKTGEMTQDKLKTAIAKVRDDNPSGLPA